MDPKLPGRDSDPAVSSAQPEGGPPAARRSHGLPGPMRGGRRRAALAGLAVVTFVAVIALAGSWILATPTASASATASQIAAGSPTPSGGPTQGATSIPTPTAAPTGNPTAAPTAPPLPALLAAIGDSYTQAYDVSPLYRRDHPQFSWVVGTGEGDGVLSVLERFRSLGGSPVVVDAATSGKKMIDAQRQANEVVAAARKLGPGETAYVTFELGTNDLCDFPMTDPGEFQARLSSALATLRTGLPAGSRILMLSVPDFAHFHAMTQADPTTRAALLIPRASNCPPYLGTDARTSLRSSNSYLSQYNGILEAGCDAIDTGAGTSSVTCTYNVELLSESDFVATDLSTYDYFHPSLTGQAKMAENAWRADAWASLPLP